MSKELEALRNKIGGIEMITHEEVKKLLIEMLPRRFSNSPSSIRKFTAHDEVIKYVRQQEKKDKLLELYKQLVNENLQINLSVLEKIKEIENE